MSFFFLKKKKNEKPKQSLRSAAYWSKIQTLKLKKGPKTCKVSPKTLPNTQNRLNLVKSVSSAIVG